MSLLVLKPANAENTYSHAASVFAEMYFKVTGKTVAVADCDDGESDLIVIGSDSVNDFLMEEILDLRLGSLGIRYGTDDYCIRSYEKDGRKCLILAGGRGRSTLYAIYGYFEKYLNCHYYWDGDVIPHSDEIPMDNISVNESPRFFYRGLRYFAHRGLKRYQAEHWSYEDWQQEFDWMAKKRLNFFMLRIGMDDVWQRAFPDDVPYPDGYRTITGTDAEGYNDRSDFWSLKYRGELREKVLAYARKLDLLYPTDCGTMTHWYSRTPEEFLENVKPEFITQESQQYIASDTGKVFDFTKKENMDYYMKLTETMVDEYEKQTGLFHTIGLGERHMFKDKQKNFALKHIAYRRIAEEIRQRYPNSKLMLASWDFIGWWTPDDVKKLMAELDPDKTVILDYTSECDDPDISFINWDVVGKFPWVFGLFHAYESESELRGPYERSDERLKIAADDPYCQGMIFWPELSHSDPLVLEYLSQSAWSPLEKPIEQIAKEYSFGRYGKYGEQMNNCWQTLLPFIKLGSWGGMSKRRPGDENFIEYYHNWYCHQDMFSQVAHAFYRNFNVLPNFTKHFDYKADLLRPILPDVKAVMQSISEMGEALKNEFVLRDALDMGRTVLGRILNHLIMVCYKNREDAEKLAETKAFYFEVLEVMAELVTLNDDRSILATLEGLKKVAPVNPDFEVTLKRNISTPYCSQPAVELMDLFRKEAEFAFDWMPRGTADNRQELSDKRKELVGELLATPLESLQPKVKYDAAETFKKVADIVEAVINKNII